MIEVAILPVHNVPGFDTLQTLFQEQSNFFKKGHLSQKKVYLVKLSP